MTQYLLSVHGSEEDDYNLDLESPEIQKVYQDVDTFNQKLLSEGAWVFAGGLHAPSTATVVRVEDDEVITTDGPFIESKEQLGGFWVIEAPDLDDALRWASEATVACRAPVEVRPFQDDPED